MKSTPSWPFCLIVLIAAAWAHADTVTLADGTVREGKIIRETDESITLQLRLGTLKGTVVIPRREITSIKREELPPDPVAAEGQALKTKAEAEKDSVQAVVAWLKVGDFYEQHPGYHAYARSSYEKALLFDADQPIARAKLGFVKGEKGWVKAEVKKDAGDEELAVQAKRPVQDKDDIAISLRRDAETIRRALEEQAARLQAMREADRRVPRDYDYDYYGGYVLTGNGLLWYPGGSMLVVDPCYGQYYPTYGSGYGGRGYYGGHHGGRYGGYNSGLSVGFRGHIGSVRFNGVLNNGYFGSGGGSIFGF
jgi:hypothetical protein